MAEMLIVEDELSINELIRRNLSLTGHHCTQAFDGLSAVQLLENEKFDLAVLRRTKKVESKFMMGDLKCDFDRHQVFLKGTVVECTPKEYELLEVLIRNRNIAFSREKPLNMVWGYAGTGAEGKSCGREYRSSDAPVFAVSTGKGKRTCSGLFRRMDL